MRRPLMLWEMSGIGGRFSSPQSVYPKKAPSALVGKMSQPGGIFLPVLAVEGLDRYYAEAGWVETVHIYAVAVGVGARDIEGFDTTDPTEKMLGDAGVETIVCQLVLAREKPETGSRYDQMAEARLGTDRTITILHFHFRRRVDLERDRSAVTGTLM